MTKSHGCDHGVTFDESAAGAMLTAEPPEATAVGFILGSPASAKVRKRWPRLDGPCPKGCGFTGIAYASQAHYVYGDW